MIDIQAVVTDVYEALERVADTERKEWAKGYYPTAMNVLGVKVPDLRNVVKELFKRLQKVPGEDVIEFSKALVASGVFECQQVAYEILSRHKIAAAVLSTGDLEVLGQGLDNWISVDGFATLVAGPAWRENQIPDNIIHGYARSEDRWKRRTAVICTVALNQKARGGTGDPIRTLDICRIVASDHDDMVAKGLSWALRELAKRDVAPVVEFIREYEDVLSARVKREVRRKIETGRK